MCLVPKENPNEPDHENILTFYKVLQYNPQNKCFTSPYFTDYKWIGGVTYVDRSLVVPDSGGVYNYGLHAYTKYNRALKNMLELTLHHYKQCVVVPVTCQPQDVVAYGILDEVVCSCLEIDTKIFHWLMELYRFQNAEF